MSSRPADQKPLAWAVILCVLAVCELVGLQLWVDQGVIRDSSRWWAQALWYYPAYFGVTLLCAGSIALLARRSLSDSFRAWRSDRNLLRYRFLLAHALLLSVFLLLSHLGFRRGAAAGEWADPWFAAWLLSGLLAATTWAFSVASPHLWIAFTRGAGGAIPWGVALGGTLWLASGFVTKSFFQFGRKPTFLAVTALLRLAGHDAVLTDEPARIAIDGFSVRMSAGCFGYEGVALVLIFSAAYLVAFRKDLAFPRAFLLVGVAVLASWTMNALRVAALVILGSYHGAYAVEGFHSVAGWLYFAAIAAGIVALSQRPWFARQANPLPVVSVSNPAGHYLTPLLVLLATAMITRIFTSEFDLLYPLRALLVGAVLFLYRARIAELGWRGSGWAAVPGVFIFFGWMALEPAPAHSAIATGLSALPEWAAATWLIFRVVGSSLTVPLAEELAFRGYVIRKLTSSDFEAVPAGQSSGLALIASSLAFGMMHGRVLAGTLAGIALALTLSRRGRLADAVVAHVTANAMIAAYVLTTGHWSLWD